MAGFWDLLDKGVKVLTGYETAGALYESSFISDLFEGDFSGAGNKIVDWWSTKPGDSDKSRFEKLAGGAMGSLWDAKNKKLNAPSVKGSRITAPRTSAGSSAYSSTAVNLGFTPRVQNAFQAAQKATDGTSIHSTLAMISGRQARGPFLSVGGTQIQVKSRSRNYA